MKIYTNYNPAKTIRKIAQNMATEIEFVISPDKYGKVLCRCGTVAWKIEHYGVEQLRFFCVTEYSPGFMRLRNDLSYTGITKKFHQDSTNVKFINKFELTYHIDEFSDGGTQLIAEEMVDICECHYSGAAVILPDRFPVKSGVSYAWTSYANSKSESIRRGAS